MSKAQQSLSLAAVKKIDMICDRFEAEWRGGGQPKIEDYLGSTAGVDRAERAELLRGLLRLELEFRAGNGGSQSSYAERFPGHADVIESIFRELQERTQAQPAASLDTSVSRESVRSGDSPRKAAATAEFPKRIGRFEILAILGQGAFGKVYRARDPHLDREVAIKVPLLETPDDIARFRREAKAAATLHHPNVCPVYEVGEDESGSYIVMAYVDGKTLADHLKERKEPLPARQAALIIRKLALALEVAHAKGIVHRDLKPGNVMIDRERKDVIITDFGLARRRTNGDAFQTKEGMVMGTPAYMAPEQARGDVQAVGPASDIYALGVILYEMLAGRPPFSGSIAEVFGQLMHVVPPPPSELRPGVDRRLDAVCVKALAKEPGNRFKSMKELADALDRVLKEASAETPAKASKEDVDSARLTRVAAALSDERKQDTRAAIDEAVQRARIPMWKWLTGAGFMAAIITLGIIFFARTPNATVLIQVDVDLKDAALTFFLDGKAVSAESLSRPIELTVGKHELLVKRGEQLERRFFFTVSRDAGPRIGVEEDLSIKPLPKTQKETLPQKFKNSLGMEFVRVPKGKFLMGGGGGTVGPKEVTIDYDFYLGKYEVTQAEWEAITGVNPSYFRRNGPGRNDVANVSDEELKRFPVESVGWDDVQLFLGVLNKRLKETGWVYRLPKEVEWEYACRGGPSDDKFIYAYSFYFDKPTNTPLADQANFKIGSKGLTRPSPVGSYKPNRLGLYDMHGNVFEWCDDIQKVSEAETKQHGVKEGRVIRGGAFDYPPEMCRATSRSWYPEKGSHASGRRPFLGLRVARVPIAKGPPTKVDDAFVPLFNGKDLTGWNVTGDDGTPIEPAKSPWTARDGEVVFSLPAGTIKRYNLSSEREFADFRLRFEFQADDKIRSGIRIRALKDANKGQGSGMVWIGDTFPFLKTGYFMYAPQSKQHLVPASPPQLRPAGEWNVMEIDAQGQRQQVFINGQKVLDFDRAELRKRPGAMSGLTRPQGVIRFLGTAGTMRLRNLAVKEYQVRPSSDPARAAAEFLLKNGAIVAGKADGKPFSLNAVNAVPPGEVVIHYIEGSRCPALTDETLASHAAGLTKLGSILGNDMKLTGSGFAAFRQSELGILLMHAGSITDAGLEAISKIPTITELGFPKNRITDAGLKHLPKLPKLWHLDLRGNRITDDGAAELAKCAALSELGLDDTGITDVGLEKLKACTRLQGLHVERTKVTAAGVKKLHEALPKCQIFTDFGTFNPGGFVTLFNGKDLTGWHVGSGNPKQWSVENGVIVARSPNAGYRNYLLSNKDYTDFTLRLEFMIEPGGKGGVVMRAIEGEQIVGGAVDHPILKINDHAAAPKYWTGTTHFVKDEKQFAKPTEDPKLPTGVWHTLAMTVRGETLTAAVGGKKIVDLRLDPKHGGNFLPGLKRVKGKIGLQAHTGTMRYRGVQISELQAPQPAADDGFVTIFNGKDFAGWASDTRLEKFRIDKADGSIVTSGDRPGAVDWLFTDKEYRDFILRFDFAVDASNPPHDHVRSGVALRGQWQNKNPHHSEVGFGLGNERTAAGFSKTNISGTIAWAATEAQQAKPRADVRPAGEWNQVETEARGSRIIVRINGVQVSDFDLATVDPKKYDDRPWIAGNLKLRAGRIGFSSARGVMRFRNIRVKELTSKITATPADPDRRVAEWLLKNGAQAVVSVSGADRHVKTNDMIPTEPFKVRRVLLGDSKVDDNDLSQLLEIPTLEYLNIAHGSVVGPGLAQLKTLPNLRGLAMHGPQGLPENIKHIANLKELRSLEIDGRGVNDDSLAHFKKLVNLEALDLVNSGDVTGRGCVHLKDLPKLRWIDFRGNTHDDEALAAIGQMKQIQAIAWGSVERVTDKGLASLTGAESLQNVNLHRSQVTDDGLKHLKAFTKLKQLILSNTKIGDPSVVHLRPLVSLESLHVKGTRLSAGGIATLKKALPGCKIEH